MAKENKKGTLSMEEWLDVALVPNWEQPYKVPENWCWARLSALVSLFNGDRGVNYPSKKDYVETGIPFINAGAIKDGRLEPLEYNYITQEKYDALRAGKIQTNDILYCLRGSLGKTAIVDFESQGAISSSLCILRASPRISVKYLYYLLNSDTIVNQQEVAENGSAQPNLSAASVLQYMVPLPPLAEQKRIVDRIESLFAKLDEAKEKAQAVVDGFEDRKAAILHKAFTGELTAEWRYKNNLPESSWLEVPLESVCSSIFDGDHMPPPKAETGVPFLVISNVNTGRLSFEDTRFVPQEYYDKLSSTRKPVFGDVLYTLVGSYGIPVIVDENRSFCFQRHMALLKPSRINSYFLWYQLQGQAFYNKASDIATGTAQLTVPIKGLRKLPVVLPPDAEQIEIVKLLDDLLSKDQKAKEAAKQAIEQIDTMKKSILTRAFRGELGTNDPNDESSVELLKKTLR